MFKSTGVQETPSIGSHKRWRMIGRAINIEEVVAIRDVYYAKSDDGREQEDWSYERVGDGYVRSVCDSVVEHDRR